MRYHGDTQACEDLRGQAQQVMLILENMMRLRKLDQHLIRFTPYDGALIVARKFFGTKIIDIYVNQPPPDDSIPGKVICLCNCNFSVGWIMEVPQGSNINDAQLYTVMACNNRGTSYKRYENVLASDWTNYAVGDRVIMIPYNSMAYLCCTDPAGGVDRVRGCTPSVSGEETVSQAWRTTYRIVPICALMTPMKVDARRFHTNG